MGGGEERPPVGRVKKEGRTGFGWTATSEAAARFCVTIASFKAVLTAPILRASWNPVSTRDQRQGKMPFDF
jgi:hypothetical protein